MVYKHKFFLTYICIIFYSLMEQSIISYKEAEDIVKKYLNSLKNLAKYAKTKNLSYQSLLSIKNGKYPEKQYTNIVFNVLKDMGADPDMEVKKIINYKINPKQLNDE